MEEEKGEREVVREGAGEGEKGRTEEHRKNTAPLSFACVAVSLTGPRSKGGRGEEGGNRLGDKEEKGTDK